MEGDIHCLLGWVGALARPSPAIFRNYRSVNPGITTTALGHSRRCCHVRSVVRYPQHRTLPRLTETRLLVVLLRSICKAQTLQLPLPRPRSVELATRDARAVTKDSAYRMQRTCAQSAAGCLVWFFLSDRSLAKDRAGTAGSRLPTERGQDKSRTLRPGRTREKRGNISTLARCAFLTRDVRFLSNQAKSTLIRTLRAEDTSKDSPSRSGARGTAPRPLGAPQRSFRCRPRNRQTG